MSRLREVPVVYGPTRATSEALRARCVALGVDFVSMRVVEENRVTNNVQGNMTTKGREVMGVLGEDPRVGIAPLALPTEMYNTRAHQELLDALFAKTKSLNNDDFAFKNGVAAFAVAGAMGIGKTTTFQAFTDVCSVVFPLVVPIYITCLKLSQDHPLGKYALYNTVCRNLRSRGYIDFQDAEMEEDPSALLFAKLEHYPGGPLRIVIIIDELDQLYMESPTSPMGPTLRRVLTETGYLGEQKSGFILTFLCGSSTRLYQLVTAVKDDESIKVFPLLASAPNLNHGKFRLLRIYSSLPTDLDTACHILAKPEGADMGIYRFFLLCGGATARALGCLRPDDFKGPDAMFPTLSTKSILYSAELLLRDQIYDWMKTNNEALLKPYFSPEYKPDELSRVEWNAGALEGGFKPCPYSEVQKMMGVLQKAGEVFPKNADTLEVLRRLVDASLVVLDFADDPALIVVYPRRVLEIGLLYLDDDRARAAAATLSEKVIKKFGEVKPGSIASGVTAIAHIIDLVKKYGL